MNKDYAHSMQDDTISRQAVLIALNESGLYTNNWLEVRNEIESLPSADPPYQYSEAYVTRLREERDLLQDVVSGLTRICMNEVKKNDK